MSLRISADDVQVGEYGINRRICSGCGREHDGGYYCPRPHTVDQCLDFLKERIDQLEARLEVLEPAQ